MRYTVLVAKFAWGSVLVLDVVDTVKCEYGGIRSMVGPVIM